MHFKILPILLHSISYPVVMVLRMRFVPRSPPQQRKCPADTHMNGSHEQLCPKLFPQVDLMKMLPEVDLMRITVPVMSFWVCRPYELIASLSDIAGTQNKTSKYN